MSEFRTWTDYETIYPIGGRATIVRGPRRWMIDGIEVDEAAYIAALANQAAIDGPAPLGGVQHIGLDWTKQ